MDSTVLPVTPEPLATSPASMAMPLAAPVATPVVAPMAAAVTAGAGMGTAGSVGGSFSGSSVPGGGVGRPKLPLIITLLVLLLLSIAFLLLGLKLAHLNNKLADQQGQVNQIKNQTVNNTTSNGNGISLNDVKNALKQLQDSGQLSLQGPAGAAGARGAKGSTGSTGATGASGAAACGGACVSLQGSTPGTQENGNINISGTALFGGRGGIGTQSPDANFNVVGTVDTTGNTTPNPTIITLANAGGEEGYGGTAMVPGTDGFPRIAYFDNSPSPGTVNYIRCHDATCSTKTTKLIDIATYYEDHSVDITLGSDGFARIIYEDYNDSSLKMARCTDADCTSPVITVVDNVNSTPGGYGMAIAMGPDDKPRITAADTGSGMLRFYRCTDADCTSPVVNDIEDNSYNYGNIGFAIGADGFARIAYQNGNDNTLHLARCTDADCTSPVITPVGSSNYPYYGLDIKFASDGFLRMAYFDEGNSGYLTFAQCSNADCTSPTITVISEVTEEGNYVGLALDSNGLAHITAENDVGPDYPLVLVNCTSIDCTGHSVATIDSGGTNNHYYGYTGAPLFVGADNYVNIAYDDDGDGNGLHFARYSLTPITAPTPPMNAFHVVGNSQLEGKVTTGNLMPLIAGDSSVTIPENNGNNYGTAIILGSDGLPRIAYSSSSGFSFYHCLTNDCTSRNRTLISDSYIYLPSMAKAPNGDILITYYSSDAGGLRLVHCQDADCGTRTISDLDTVSGSAGYYGSVIKIGPDGLPRIAYVDTGYIINYIKCTSLDCTGDTPVLLDTPDGVQVPDYIGLDMALGSDGMARIVYLDNNNHYLQLARCTTTNCSSATTTAVNTKGSYYLTYYGLHILLASDDTPRIAFADDDNGYLWYIKCNDANCTSPTTTKLANENEDMNGGFGMVLMSDGTARLTYEDYNKSYQYLLTCTNSDCSSYTTQLFDSSEGNQSDYGMGMVLGSDGYLYLAYTGDGDYNLHFARLVASGQPTSIGSSSASYGQAYLQGVTLNGGAVLSGSSNSLQVTTNNPGGFAASFNNDGNTPDSHGISVRAGYYEQGFTYFLRAQSNYGGTIGYIADNNGTFALTDVSDRRTKTNITDTTLQGLDVVNGLQVVDFNRLANPDGPRITGFIAQDVQGVYPQAVTTDPDGLLGINKDAFIPVLVKAIQEQQKQIEALQNANAGSQTGTSDSLNTSGSASVDNLTVAGATTTKTLTVTNGATIKLSLTVQGHIITANSSGNTTAAPNAAACTGATVTIDGDDTSGTITIVTGSGCAATGNLATVSFASAFGAAPHVTLTADNDKAGTLRFYVTSRTANGFAIATNDVPTGATTYSFTYQVLQ